MLSFILVLFLLFALVLTFYIVSSFFAFLRTRVPFVTTNSEDIKFIVEKIGLNDKDVFYDLGSGNGKVVFLVEKLSGAKAQGFEIGSFNLIYSKLKALLIRSKAKFSGRNFFTQDWSGASVIYCYLFPPLMGRIEEKFKTEMKRGSIAIIRDFPFPTVLPKNEFFTSNNHKLYIYKVD